MLGCVGEWVVGGAQDAFRAPNLDSPPEITLTENPAWCDRAHTASALDIVRVISEEDLVVVHYKFTTGPDDRGQAIIDIFRIANGKLVEHWDVIQQSPITPLTGTPCSQGQKQISPFTV